MIKFLETVNEELTYFRQGSDGILYRLSDDKVAKFEHPTTLWEQILGCKVGGKGDLVRKEANIVKHLYENGVSVPTPYGVFEFKPARTERWTEIGLPRKFPAFVMQYIEGVVPHPKYLDSDTQDRVSELVEVEREKVRKLDRIKSFDAMGWENTIWVPKEDKIYLIDFSKWEFVEK